MHKKKLLVTTALEKTWGNNDELIFLGEWCKRYDRKLNWEKRKFKTLDYHWKNGSKKQQDYMYLGDLYEKVLEVLSRELNELHGVNKPIRYWRIIIGPWLLTYLAVIWDRWESIMQFCNRGEAVNTFVSSNKYQRRPAYDYQDALSLMSSSDDWNYFVYNDIMEALDCNNIKKLQSSVKPSCDRYNCSTSTWLKKHIKNIVSYICEGIGKNRSDNLLFVSSYLPSLAIIRLFLKLKKIPLWLNFQPIEIKTVHSKKRNKLSNLFPINSFEKFLGKIIYKDIPLLYFEGFKQLIDKSGSKPNAKIIFTANAHFGNELFKVWSAENVINGASLIISDHGTAIPPVMSTFQHEEKISDKKITWHKPIHEKHIKLTPNKLVREVKSSQVRKYIVIIGRDSPRYSYRCQSGGQSSLLLEDFDQQKKFLSCLDEKVFDELKLRPYRNCGWLLKDRYIDTFGVGIISKCKKFGDVLEKSRILVCTYPETNFTECMNSGAPTILLYMEEYWILNRDFHALVQMMKKAKIIFSDAEEAANHINSVWDDPKVWWDSPQVVAAREKFFDMCGRTNPNWLDEWSSFFKKELEEIVDE